MNENIRKANEIQQQIQLVVQEWKPSDALSIYAQLEHPNWAPWLEASPETISGRATVFPKGQLLIKENGLLVASLSMNQITWDGNLDTLPSWDTVAGVHTTDYSETYQPSGNALVLMSMNVAPEAKGKQLPTKLISHTKLLAQELGIEYILGSFRPSGFGFAKKQHNFDLSFWDYCNQKQSGTHKPEDPWLRSLWWNGMQLLKEDPQAMVVTISTSVFEEYKKGYRPELWTEVTPGIWECGEVGTWVVTDTLATYQESNVWGIIS